LISVKPSHWTTVQLPVPGFSTGTLSSTLKDTLFKLIHARSLTVYRLTLLAAGMAYHLPQMGG